ncbi:long-chain acyl-CoA synthetase [Litorivivens lipolytica]|uniref:Long-chain-fatty-acid--CoA ligase n=1 Tax=Litorivivens lipolytica TaxID=1524264 RepID=A0A7W4W3Z3_9GAMM|nr:long-chain acyl-CoA synthetase [Litorivivens lipolytica]
MSDQIKTVNEAISAARARAGVPETINPDKFKNLVELFHFCIDSYRARDAVSSIGHTLTYDDLERHSAALGAYLQQKTDLKPGDRVAIQMPNIIQYPVALFAVLRAGFVVVNTNPLYSPREIKHQLNDSGAKALILLANVGEAAAEVLADTPVKTVIMTELADLHPGFKGRLINFAARHVKKMIPDYEIKGSISFKKAVAQGRKLSLNEASPEAGDVALLQYTGGTTGVSKGAMISHRNLVSNILQAASIFDTYGFEDGPQTFIGPLPLYHIYSFTLGFIVMMQGNHTVLIPNPRDLDAFIKEMKKWKFSGMSGLNTLFVGLCKHPEFKTIDFSHLKMTLSGGMALTTAAANTWKEITGCEVYEGYGLTETSPVVSTNPGGANELGTIGVPVPNTEVKIAGEDGSEQPIGERGELCVRGPQVMLGYWQRDDETAKMIDEDGWLHTGDVAVVREDGYLKIVDRMKDMILVSGFNVYPNEIEDVVCAHPEVAECAAIGVPDDKSGEVVKIFVVGKNGPVNVDSLKAHLREQLTGYKMPKHIEQRDELPKSNVGKVLRRELRDEELAKA